MTKYYQIYNPIKHTWCKIDEHAEVIEISEVPFVDIPTKRMGFWDRINIEDKKLKNLKKI